MKSAFVRTTAAVAVTIMTVQYAIDYSCSQSFPRVYLSLPAVVNLPSEVSLSFELLFLDVFSVADTTTSDIKTPFVVAGGATVDIPCAP